MSSRRPGPAVARRQLRLKLRRARNEANLTQNEIAEQLGWSPSKILRIENGQSSLTLSDLIALLTLYPDLAGERDELIELARDARRTTVSSRYSDVLTPQFAEWLEHEAYASTIRQFENQIIPGVLQTDEYAYSIVNGLLGKGVDEKLGERIVEARLERAEPLRSVGGPTMEFIVDESALRRAVGNEAGSNGYGPMIEQLRALQRYNTKGRRLQGDAIEDDLNPNISIQVVPSILGAYPAMRGPFELIEFSGDTDPMVYFENAGGDEVAPDLRDRIEQIGHYLDMFADMKRALPESVETNAQLDAIIADMEAHPKGLALQPRPSRKPRKTMTPA
jgi:transcriptional regulator with XRE-family HTH domain